MNDSTKEIDFTTLKDNFDKICDTVNDGAVMTLALESGRKVFIMSEDNYDNIPRFVVTGTQLLKEN